ncbi:hypothetical protein BY458DRAFT_540356 [Sporodiniella umbellata]|nr:hypothetical protein BY458DRAFT_540356 [Sporodiniella umbellata]
MSDPQSKAESLIKEGNEALATKKIGLSIEKFGEACQLLDQYHGELAPQNGEAYFLYGKALLEFAILQNTILGQDAQANVSAAEDQQKTIKEVEISSSNPLIQMESIPEFKDDIGAEEASNEEDEDEDGAAMVDDDFEAAWDLLDTARVVLEKSGDEKSQLRLADVHLCLADVSLETEKFDASLIDFEKAIAIKEKYLENDNRELAEAYYKFALALEFSSEKTDGAVPNLQKAIDVLNKRLDLLKKIEGAEKTVEVEKEIKEIEDLVPDMKLKVEELSTKQATEKEAADMLKQLLGIPKPEEGSSKQSLESVSVNDLSNLVKRKKKEISEINNSEQKKPKLE